MQTTEQILNFIKENNLNVQEIERQSGIKSTRIYKWLDGIGSPKVEDSEKLQNWAKKYMNKSAKLEIVPELAPEDEITIKEKGLTIQALADLAEGNKTGNAANLVLARQLEELRKSTVSGQQETLAETVDMVLGLRDLLVEIAAETTGKKEDEIRQAFDNKVKEASLRVGRNGTQP